MNWLKEQLRTLLLSSPRLLEGFNRLNQNRKFRDYQNSVAAAMQIAEDRQKLHDLAAADIGATPIDYFEFGVYGGKSFLPWMQRSASADSRFFGFDTFTGLPEDWHENKPAGTFDMGNQVPDTGDDNRASFHAGLFQDSLAPFLKNYDRKPGNKLVVHVDCDIFSGAIYVLFAMEPLMQDGDMVIFDEFKDHNNEFRAFEIFTAATSIDLAPFARGKKNNQWAFHVSRNAG